MSRAAAMSWPRWSLADVLRDRPGVRVNQLGYLPDGPKVATLVDEGQQPVEAVVRDRTGEVVWRGWSQPWRPRPDPSSGLAVHLVDFTGLAAIGAGCTVHAAGQHSHPFAVTADLYRPLSEDALRFFTRMRSGAEIEASTDPVYARPAGHLSRPPNRGDLAVPAWSGPDAERLYPGWRCQGTFDVSGGWYDAGDYGKYVTSGSIAVWQLLSTLELLPSAATESLTAFAAALLAECRWQLDWMLRMQVPPGDPLAGMAFHRVHGTQWSPLPGWPHEDPTERVLHRPSTGATLHLAAVAAHAATRFRPSDPGYASRLLAVARAAHHAAAVHPRLMAPDDHARFGGGPYGDEQLDDDFYWAAAELWLATGEDRFLDEVLSSPRHSAEVFDLAGFDFDSVDAPARLDLALFGRGLPDHERVRGSVLDAAQRLLELQGRQPWGQPYAPADGWDWGSNGRVLNNLVVLSVAHLLTGDVRYLTAVRTGMDYLLGRNALGQSYLTGYGTDHSRHQRTRQFGHDHDPAFPLPPPGALAGGANSRPAPDFPYDPRLVGLPPQCCYLDEPTSEVTNDVCIRWNAPLVWVAVLLSRADGFWSATVR